MPSHTHKYGKLWVHTKRMIPRSFVKVVKFSKNAQLNICAKVISFKISLCVEACNFNHGQNSGRLFDIFAQFSFTTSESELNYYHQNLNLRVLSQAAEQVKTLDLRKSRNFKKKPVIQKPMLNIYARKWPKICCKLFQKTPDLLIGTLLQICKSSNIFAFTWK